MAAHDLQPADLRRVEIERFVQERRATGRVQLASTRALVALLGYLRGLGVVPPAGSREAPTPAGALLDDYAEYLRVGRGLAAETVRCYRTRLARSWPTASGPPAIWRSGRLMWRRSTSSCCRRRGAEAWARRRRP